MARRPGRALPGERGVPAVEGVEVGRDGRDGAGGHRPDPGGGAEPAELVVRLRRRLQARREPLDPLHEGRDPLAVKLIRLAARSGSSTARSPIAVSSTFGLAGP